MQGAKAFQLIHRRLPKFAIRLFYFPTMSTPRSPLAATNKENINLSHQAKADDQPTSSKRSRMENESRFLVKKLSEHATLPVRGSAGAAGYDLASAYDCVIPARGKGIAQTDLSIAIPSGTYARVAPRSGLAVKHFIDTGAGVVDEDYRGNIGVVLFNHSDTDFKITKGDRIAQLILERIVTPPVEEVDNLEDTKRGGGGYGSTGVQGHLPL